MSEIESLVRLLDDPDRAVQSSVRARLEELGRDALPELRSARAAADADLRDQIDEVVHDLHLEDLQQAWHSVMGSTPVDLERGAFLIALYRYPTLDIPTYQQQLDDIAEEARPRVASETGPMQGVELARFLADDLGFTGNRDHYYDPSNSYLNRVLDRRLGIPISLSVIYVLVGQRLDLPVAGVNLPAHFLAKYEGQAGEVFLDPFNDGEVISKESCVRFLLKAGIRPLPFYFRAAAPRDVLLRMMRNLLAVAKEAGQTQTVEELTALMAPYDPEIDASD
jgi:regulator of sirC expression with transglutaminase-like and TPR domain